MESVSRPLSVEEVKEIMKLTPMTMTATRYKEITKYHLTKDFILLREAYYNNNISEEGSYDEWADEFYNFPTTDGSSFVERRLKFLSNPLNKDKYPFEYDMILTTMSVNSLMFLDGIEDNMSSWWYYDELSTEEKRLRRILYPHIAEQEEKEEEERRKEADKYKDVIEYSDDLPEGVRKFNGEYQAVDPDTGIWYKTQPEYGYKHNLFVWIKEQGNSEELTEELESWRSMKPKLAPDRKRNQIIITNIIKGVCERHLYIISQLIGPVIDIYYPVHKVTGKQDKAFIEFKKPESVEKAIRLLNHMPLGRAIINVDIPNVTDNTKRR
jgi:hypothetical protein